MESRYARQIALPEIGEEGQRLLEEARILIVGVGGLGSPVALYLTGAGVGTIGLVDDDTVNISNLQRQVLYEEQQTGLPKVQCARERLLSINSGITVTPYVEQLTVQNAERIINDYDIIIDGTDNFSARYLMSDVCHALGKPMIYGAICALDGQVSVLCKGHATYRTLYPDEAGTLAMPHPGKEVVGVTPAVVGSVQANQALQLICGYGEPLIDRLWTIDLRTMQTFIVNI